MGHEYPTRSGKDLISKSLTLAQENAQLKKELDDLKLKMKGKVLVPRDLLQTTPEWAGMYLRFFETEMQNLVRRSDGYADAFVAFVKFRDEMKKTGEFDGS